MKNRIIAISVSFSLLILIAVYLCSPGKKPYVDVNQFSGDWNGPWSWDHSQTAKLVISGDDLSFHNFPYENGAGIVQVLNGNGKISFFREYGPNGKPCLVLELLNERSAMSIFIDETWRRKTRLDYMVNISEGKYVEFYKP